MEIDFYIQSQAFLYSLLFGVGLGMLYGVFKFIRAAFLSTKTAVIIADIIFMLIASIGCFYIHLQCCTDMSEFILYSVLCAAFWHTGFHSENSFSRIYCPIINAINVIIQKIKTKFKKITKKLLKSSNNILYNMSKKIDTFRNKRIGLSVRKKVKASNEKGKEKTAD